MAYLFRGAALAQVGDGQKAIADIERALELGLPAEIIQDAEGFLNELKQ